MRKQLIALACVLCFSFMLTACGSSENNENAQGTGTPSASVTEQPSNTPTEAPTSTPTPTPEPHEHSYTSAVTKEATCTEVGETTYTCSCGDTYTEDIAMISHIESDWIVITEVVGATNGLQHKVCTVCGVELATEEIYPEVVASGKLSDANVEWKIIGTTLYVSGTGEIPDFTYDPDLVERKPEKYPIDRLRDWQVYYKVIEKVVIEEGITKIGKDNFSYFPLLKEVVFADSVVELGKFACRGSGIENINFNNITKLGNGAFMSSPNIISVQIPGTIQIIPDSCFTNCPNLSQIHIEDGVTTIEKWTFVGTAKGCNIYLPNSISSIHEESFNSQTIYVKSGSYAEKYLNDIAHSICLTVISE